MGKTRDKDRPAVLCVKEAQRLRTGTTIARAVVDQ